MYGLVGITKTTWWFLGWSWGTILIDIAKITVKFAAKAIQILTKVFMSCFIGSAMIGALCV